MEIRIPIDRMRDYKTDAEAAGNALRQVYAELVQYSEDAFRKGYGTDTTPPSEQRAKAAKAREAARITEELKAEAKNLETVCLFLDKVSRIYSRAEEKITDRYNLEDQVFPKTLFGTSRFENLAQFRDLIPIESSRADLNNI